MARPSKRTKELCDKITGLLYEGRSLAEICRMDGMPSYQTVWRWEKEDEQFRNDSAQAREAGTHFLAGDALRIADDQDIDPQHKRIMVDTRIRLIGKWNSKAYGDKITQEHTGQNGGPIQHQNLDDAALEARVAALMAQVKP